MEKASLTIIAKMGNCSTVIDEFLFIIYDIRREIGVIHSQIILIIKQAIPR
jgi:hypothetical protein